MIVGYGRTSDSAQIAGLEAQERDLHAAGAEKLFLEQASALGPREKLSAALDFVREGDVLVVTKPDRLARSVADLLGIVGTLERKAVSLRIISMGGTPVDTATPTGKLMLTMLGAVAAFERDLMLERQREGIAKAKAEGRYKGRAPTARRQRDAVLALHSEGVGPSEIARRLGIARSSVHALLKISREAGAASGPRTHEAGNRVGT
jgi:DNA invertase Pin-like site-specific DNA recombinase